MIRCRKSNLYTVVIFSFDLSESAKAISNVDDLFVTILLTIFEIKKDGHV